MTANAAIRWTISILSVSIVITAAATVINVKLNFLRSAELNYTRRRAAVRRIIG
jgi:hypothetical protein